MHCAVNADATESELAHNIKCQCTSSRNLSQKPQVIGGRAADRHSWCTLKNFINTSSAQQSTTDVYICTCIHIWLYIYVCPMAANAQIVNICRDANSHTHTLLLNHLPRAHHLPRPRSHFDCLALRIALHLKTVLLLACWLAGSLSGCGSCVGAAESARVLVMPVAPVARVWVACALSAPLRVINMNLHFYGAFSCTLANWLAASRRLYADCGTKL